MYWCHYSWVMMVELLLLLLVLLLEMLLQSNRVMVEILVVVVMLLLVKVVVVLLLLVLLLLLLLQWKGWTRARAGGKIRMLGVLNAVVGSGADGWEGPHNLRRRQNANAVRLDSGGSSSGDVAAHGRLLHHHGRPLVTGQLHGPDGRRRRRGRRGRGETTTGRGHGIGDRHDGHRSGSLPSVQHRHRRRSLGRWRRMFAGPV